MSHSIAVFITRAISLHRYAKIIPMRLQAHLAQTSRSPEMTTPTNQFGMSLLDRKYLAQACRTGFLHLQDAGILRRMSASLINCVFERLISLTKNLLGIFEPAAPAFGTGSTSLALIFRNAVGAKVSSEKLIHDQQTYC